MEQGSQKCWYRILGGKTLKECPEYTLNKLSGDVPESMPAESLESARNSVSVAVVWKWCILSALMGDSHV